MGFKSFVSRPKVRDSVGANPSDLNQSIGFLRVEQLLLICFLVIDIICIVVECNKAEP